MIKVSLHHFFLITIKYIYLYYCSNSPSMHHRISNSLYITTHTNPPRKIISLFIAFFNI